GRGGGGEGRECDRRDALRHLRDGQQLDGDLRVRHGGARAQAVGVPRARRPRREAPVLELLAATPPELRRGLSEGAARTVAYQLFEKLGFGAGAVTDSRHVLAGRESKRL